jgi:beta-phosphoglucomutase-like phosphatase (HAD superfamily)
MSLAPSPLEPSIEIVRPDFPRGPFRAALFDFDGTLSLIRRNWPGVMIPMMVEVLEATNSGESRAELHAAVEDFVMRLNGRQTIFQMIRLAEEVQKRGGQPRDPLDYKHAYHELLLADMGDRVQRLTSGQTPAADATVPESHRLLEALAARGITLYLASGTDLAYVRAEAAALRLDHFFGPHIYGALDDYQNFSKAMIVEKILGESGVAPHELVAFGDGFVEIQEVARRGGLAIGVASEEERRQGVNAWKRSRLIDAGAHLIVGDYRRQPELFALLGLS